MKKVLLTFFYVSLFWSFAECQDSYSFRTINKDNGLIDNYVNQSFEDSRGFIWFATQGGLCRYDGHAFVKYDIPQSKSTNQSDFSRNNITCLKEDKNKNLWIGTLSGVYLFNLENNRIISLGENFPNQPSPILPWVEDIVFDKLQNAWIGTREGLVFYTVKTGKCEYFKHNENDSKSIANNSIHSICIDSKNDIWFGTYKGGLEKLSKDRKSFIHYSSLLNGIKNRQIRGLIEDAKKSLFVLTSDGLYLKDSQSEMFHKQELINPATKKEFTTVFHSMCEDKNGNLLICTLTDGLIIYNTRENNCLNFNENSAFKQKICSNSIQDALCDKQGNIWLSTNGGGVSLYNPMTNWFSHVYKSQDKNSLPGNLVSCFCEDHTGKIWIGTDGNGFAKFDKQKKSFETFSKQNGLTSNAVLDICEIKKNILAIATWAGGLNIFNIETKIFSNFQYINPHSDGSLQNIFGLNFDKTKRLLWCNTSNDGIQIFNIETMRFLTHEERLKQCPFAEIPRYSIKTVFDKDKNVWIVDGSELYRFAKNKTYNYSKTDSLKKSNSVNNLMDLLLDSQGELWANSSKGVCLYDKKLDCFHLLEYPEYDLSKPFGLLEDSIGNIWISTYKSLFRYSKNKNKIEDFSQKWGMPEMQYFRKSTLRSRDGYLYFGGLNGFIVLNEKQKTTTLSPKLYLTKLTLNNTEQQPNIQRSGISKDISFLNKLELTYDRNYITLEFAALNFIDNNKSKFKYLLKGFNETWIETQNDRKVQFMNIPPGNYTFMLKTTDSEGKWIRKPLCLQIIVLPPWWKTLWFRFFLIIFTLITIWLYIRYRIHNISRINKQLEYLVDDRTKELTIMNQHLEFQKSTIQKQYEDIKENHFIIELKNSQLQDALELKDKLMTVIAHDFKSPLWSLQGILKLMQKKIMNKEFNDLEKAIEMSVSSSTQLMDQMVSILDWSLGNDKTIVHIPINTNISNCVADVLSLVNESAMQKGITIKTSNHSNTAALVDPRMINAIIRNIIINSIKFTDKKGKILITIKETENEVVCEIEDNGKGMELEFVERLLSNDELQAKDYQSGFGLMICKSFIKRNKGTLEIESTLEKGTIFRIYLPKGDLLQSIDSGSKAEISEHSLEFENAEMSMLIIDDNKDLIGYLSEVFSDSYTVYGAYDGEKGLQIARNVIPDIILSDVYMPLLDGMGLCKMLKSESLTCHIPIILISAKNLQSDQIEGLMSGADDYITKPFDTSILKQKVHTIIKNRKRLNQHFKTNIITEGKAVLPESYSDKITKEATDLIIQNLFNPDFSVDSLAKQLFLSRSQLYRKFVGTLGQTPKEYILMLKFNKAVEMLKTKKYKIADIAFELGFADAHYFSTSFAQRFGVSPSNYFPKEINS
jgi:ligand-binding sensor domain-containing protein/signal transduction histidine kinase/DNA-binding response OmpR family regulator